MTAAAIAQALGGHRLSGDGFLVHCPVPGHGSGRGDRRPSLSIRDGEVGLLLHCFAGCEPLAVFDELRRRGLVSHVPAAQRATRKGCMRGETEAASLLTRQKAQFLWRQRQAIWNTPAEQYLRRRGYADPIPPTLCFLPARSKYPPALISAFTMPRELEPGVLDVDDGAVVGVHLIKLTADGRKVGTRPDKITLGPSLGTPIVLSAVNDALGLIVVEGVETGLSILAATGCGVWVAGSSGRMPALANAVPSYVEYVTVAGEADGGLLPAASLAERLRARGFAADVRVLGEPASSSEIGVVREAA